ncbi:FAD-dependent oxidoreductase [Polaromonas sp. SM01]|uniref:FAD-dependent oxidoreductase n=1 Tax=Polaromonas sp. SM01 TaxID=3085630 RepID=UPI002982760A|nr:FAD-dependent oxidoreductase [Polaromonas sp. SM01]MDW5441674.1 FAD-dependent oxidoreductase [Polaromonas sp. SM01]
MTSTVSPFPDHVPVLIAGGGPVGMTLAALLARYGIASLVIEADDGYCAGSRAICMSRRSQEILSWVGADQPLVDKGLSWVGGRSYFRDREVLHFQMPSEPTQRYAPMVNIQQFYAEEFAHKAAMAQGGLVDVRWSSKVIAVRPQAEGAQVDIEAADGMHTVQADWVVACDGGRSTVREQLGLQLEGTQYEGKYVIVDVVQKTKRAVERLAWFDPPSNPGSTILMHRQPDDVWRIDYQIRDDEDPVEAVKPENVLPRVQSHLSMIGENEPWESLWISIYNAKCLTLPSYRHGRVLFAGDAGHLVPIFGVRGLNSGLDDAGNLAWKLALVQQGRAADSLLDSYSSERVQATRENIAYGAKSTEFMAPPDYGFKLLREAALRLCTENPAVSSLVNPRQSTPVEYLNSPLNLFTQEAGFKADARAGMPAPEAKLRASHGEVHLTSQFGGEFVLLYFAKQPGLPAALQALATPEVAGPAALQVICIARQGQADARTLIDEPGQAHDRYDAEEGTLYLVRPDGYVMGRWREGRAADVQAALKSLTGQPCAA